MLRQGLIPFACTGASDTVAPVSGTFRLATLWLVALGACRARPAEPSPDAGPALTLLKQRAVHDHAELALASYDQAVAATSVLRTAVTSFLDRPTAASLRVAREAWLAARVPYAQTEVFRFYGGPIDRLETLINAWPIDESYIDAVVGAPESGIINTLSLHRDISAAELAALNEREGETSISTGFHAIEFLLWGQDLRAGEPGRRSHTDFLPSARNGRRRALYLQAATDLLLHHLAAVADAWRPHTSDHPFRERWLAQASGEALALIIKGVGTLVAVELAGERLLVAYETKDQEDEHSCFSDNTHNDVIGNLLGVENVLTGRLRRADGTTWQGTGLLDVIASVDAGLAQELAVAVARAIASARAIPAPFDQAILGDDQSPGRCAVAATIQAVRALGDRLARAGTVLGLAPQLAGGPP